MKSETKRRALFVIADYISTMIAMVAFNVIRFEYFSVQLSSLRSFLISAPVVTGILCIPVMLLVIYYMSGYYYDVNFRSRLDEIINTIATTFVGSLLIYFIVLANDAVVERGTIFELVGTLWLTLFVCIYPVRLFLTMMVVRNADVRRAGFETLIVGNSALAVNMAEKIKQLPKSVGFNVLGYVDTGERSNSPATIGDLPVYPLNSLAEICDSLQIKKLIVVDQRQGFQATVDLIQKVFPLGRAIYVSPFLFQKISGKQHYGNVVGEPLVEISRPDLPAMTASCKRAVDLVSSIIALVVLSPFMLAIGIAVKCTSPGPVLYFQERVGLHKRRFKIIKFRTMYTDAEANGPALSSADDPRVTPLGRILRKYRIDELPQFFNVLKGDMSIVGPRPERPYYADRIVERVPYYSLIHSVRPGITSLGMVKYGYATEVDQMVERLRYDLVYIENVSAGLDIKIIIYTIRTVLTGRGV